MAPGQFNSTSKNYGGYHTGDGKKKHTGVYNQSIRITKEPSSNFMVGKSVFHRKTGEKGVVIEKDKKVPRSMIYVNFENNKKYCYTNSLYTEDHMENTKVIILNKGNKVKKTNKSTDKNNKKFKALINKKKEMQKLENFKNKEKIKNKRKFKEDKKELNELIDDSIVVINDTFKMIKTDNNYVNDLIQDRYKRCISFDEKVNKNKTKTDFKVSKYRLLDLLPMYNVSNKNDFYKIVELFGASKE